MTNATKETQSNVTSRVLEAAQQVLNEGVSAHASDAEQQRWLLSVELTELAPSPAGLNQTPIRSATPHVVAWLRADQACPLPKL